MGDMSSTDKTNTATLSQRIISEADAYLYLEGLRWGRRPLCAHCSSQYVRLIPPTNGVSRKTASGSMSQRRVWKCQSCTKQFSVLTNTIMHATKIPVRTWVLVFFDMVASKNGISAKEVERRYGLSLKSAWHLLHRLRFAMSASDWPLFTGDVVADETYIGGDPKNWHANDPRHDTKKRGRGTHKTPVVTVMESKSGRTRSRAVANVTGKTLRKAISDVTDMPFATLHTDALTQYVTIGNDMAGHFFVDHSTGEYVTDKSKGTNQVEAYYSQLKRSLDGTHHHVSREHLQRYLGEFDFRYSTCKMSDAERMSVLVAQCDGRLPYSELVNS